MMAGLFAQNKAKIATLDTTLTLKYVVRPPKVRKADAPLLLLLHGVGSNERDLFSFADALDPHYWVVSARAPFTISEGSYKWYTVDFSSGKPLIDSVQAEQSRRKLSSFVAELKRRYTTGNAKVYVGGFSQGAIMSLSLGLTEPQRIHGVAVLSGRALEEIKPAADGKKYFTRLKALIVHGSKDTVLPLRYAQQSKSLLEGLGIKTEYHEIEAGHQITVETLRFLNTWLSQ